MSTVATFWEELAATALVGSERQDAIPTPPTGPLAEALASTSSDAKPARLLAAAAATALYLRAGRLATAHNAVPFAACDDADLPACSPQAALHLSLMLDGIRRQALPEWLTALAAAGKRVAAAELPALLDLGRTNQALRPLITPVLGRRGHWLAALNPDWGYASTALPASPAEQDATLLARWETGSATARLALLQELRGVRPAQARELVAATWATEKADERTGFLTAFAQGLGMDDEPFLEAALDDRSKQVRRQAADLLARLPTSRLAQRMLARVMPLLAWQPEGKASMLGLRRGTPAGIAVTLPDECDKAMLRDGVEPKGTPHGMGEKAWLLCQMLGAVPPSHWASQWNTTPAQVVTAMRSSEWHQPLLRGLHTAIARYHDASWAEALLRDDAARDDAMSTLVAVLPLAQREALLLDLLRRHKRPLGRNHPALDLLRQHREPWSAALAHALLAKLRERVALNDADLATDWHLRSSLDEFACLLPPDMAEEASAGWLAPLRQLPYWAATIDTFESLLHFRHAMLKEIRQ